MWPNADLREELTIQPVLVSQLWYFLAIYFAINPHLFHYRLWPVPPAALSIWSLCTNYAFKNPALNSFNFGITSVGATMVLKLVELAMMKEPPRCNGREVCSTRRSFCLNCLKSTAEYMGDPRCLHWNRSGAAYIPKDTRRNDSHTNFYIDTAMLLVKHAIYTDSLLAFLANFDVPNSGTIFRKTFAITDNYVLHLPYSFLGALVPTFVMGLLVMNVIELQHDLGTLLAAPSMLSQPASSLKTEWAPLFDSPYRATSLRDFWTNRWQGLSRRAFSKTGGRAGRVIGGYMAVPVGGEQSRPVVSRVGYVVGTFLMSGLIHDIGTWGMGGGMDLWRVTGYFLIQGVGVVVESALGLEQTSRQKEDTRAPGSNNAERSLLSLFRRCLAAVWVPLWVVLPATMMAEAWLRRGFAATSFPYSPMVVLLNFWNGFAYEK